MGCLSCNFRVSICLSVEFPSRKTPRNISPQKESHEIELPYTTLVAVAGDEPTPVGLEFWDSSMSPWDAATFRAITIG